MKGISGFLERFRDFIPPQLAATRAVRATILEVFAIDIPETAIAYERGMVHIKTGGALKSEIILRKKEIVDALRTKLGPTVRDIR